MPLRVFRLRALPVANGMAVLASRIIVASVLMLSLQLQDVDGFSPLAAGLCCRWGVFVGTVATIAPCLAACLGLKPVLGVGTALMTAGALMLARVTASSTYVGVILPAMIVLGTGFGAFISTATISATGSVRDSEQVWPRASHEGAACPRECAACPRRGLGGSGVIAMACV